MRASLKSASDSDKIHDVAFSEKGFPELILTDIGKIVQLVAPENGSGDVNISNLTRVAFPST